MMRRVTSRSGRLALLALFGAMACGEDGSATLEPLAPVTVLVNETMRVELSAMGGGSAEFATAPFDLPGARLTVTGTAASGGEVRWTPLASHVGSHTITVQLRDGSDVFDETELQVTVEPSADSAPIFLRPGAGGTFDLTADPVVAFDIEVRDDDSARVTIRENGELPDGAFIVELDDKRARFEWQPTPAQLAASERWTIPLAADDRDHPPTELDFVAVLRGAAKPGCPGDAPVVAITAPAEGGRVPNTGGYRVVAEVTDDMGLRDPPLLFFSTAAPEDPANPDVTTFEQLVMMPEGANWSARVPTLGLGDGDEADLYVLVSATDNDDPSGASCDHRTDSPLRAFTALGGGGAALDSCETCSSSTDCAGGICASAGSGGRCVPGCSGDGVCTAGSCGATVSVEGSVLAGCGPVEDVCGGGTCVDDGREDDDSLSQATAYGTPVRDGQICTGDPDLFAITVRAGERVRVTLDGYRNAAGDLDLQLLGSDGVILDSSASTDDGEEVEHCFATGGTAYAKVIGYGGAENGYSLSATVTADAAMCCMDDRNEENDTAATGASFSVTGGSGSFDGTVCPSDPDWYRFSVSGPTRVVIDLLIGAASADLDLELRGPSGSLIASSRGVTDTETIDARVTTSGTYAVGVLGFLQDSSDYVAEVRLTADASGCTNDRGCPLAQVCSAGSCVDRACRVGGSCPGGPCPTPGPGTASECGASCTVSSDCRTGEACKWLPEGRFCARRGTRGSGDACTSFTDCDGLRGCLDWPGGTCARARCTANSDCDPDTFCIPVDGQSVCARSCWGSSSVCRSGYRCGAENDRGGSVQLVCVPF